MTLFKTIMIRPSERFRRAPVSVTRDIAEHPFLTALCLDEEPAKLTLDDVGQAAAAIEVPRANLLALLRQESASRGFTQLADGRWFPKVRLELHKLHKFTDGTFTKERPDLFKASWNIKDANVSQAVHFERMNDAAEIIEGMYGIAPVLMAAGWGVGQVQGFNFQTAGSGTVDRFVQRMAASEVEQLRGVCAHLENAGIRPYLAARDWKGVARHYNGSGRIEEYARELEQNYHVVTGRLTS